MKLTALSNIAKTLYDEIEAWKRSVRLWPPASMPRPNPLYGLRPVAYG